MVCTSHHNTSTTMDSPIIPPSPRQSSLTVSQPADNVNEDEFEDCLPAGTAQNSPGATGHIQTPDESLFAEVIFLRASFQSLETMYLESEGTLSVLQKERDDAMAKCFESSKTIEELERDRDGLREALGDARVREEERNRRVEEKEMERESLETEIYEGMREREELARKIDNGSRERDGLLKEIEGIRVKVGELNEEKREMDKILSKCLVVVMGIRNSLTGVYQGFAESKGENGVDDHAESQRDDDVNSNSSDQYELMVSKSESLFAHLNSVSKLVIRVEETSSDYQRRSKKEKKELESSVVSLTEENRDINSLLRMALVEKESVERSLNKLKGTNPNSDQKRVPLFQIAERGLQRVGFGFMMGTAGNEPAAPAVSDAASSTASNLSDGSECDEEVISLASTVEKIMKNLRLEITQLRRALEESRSDIDRLQSLTEKQSQQIMEQTTYIKELEDREAMLTQNIEEFLMEMKSVEDEASRWREACELEVEAGKTVVEERDKVATILQQELEKTRSALEIAESKLKLKEELASAAMAAQEAAEKSLQLVDSRASELRESIEELTKQLEEAENREKNRSRVRRICWPWRPLKANTANGVSARGGGNRITSVRRMLPEMQSLLQYSV